MNKTYKYAVNDYFSMDGPSLTYSNEWEMSYTLTNDAEAIVREMCPDNPERKDSLGQSYLRICGMNYNDWDQALSDASWWPGDASVDQVYNFENSHIPQAESDEEREFYLKVVRAMEGEGE